MPPVTSLVSDVFLKYWIDIQYTQKYREYQVKDREDRLLDFTSGLSPFIPPREQERRVYEID